MLGFAGNERRPPTQQRRRKRPLRQQTLIAQASKTATIVKQRKNRESIVKKLNMWRKEKGTCVEYVHTVVKPMRDLGPLPSTQPELTQPSISVPAMASAINVGPNPASTSNVMPTKISVIPATTPVGTIIDTTPNPSTLLSSMSDLIPTSSTIDMESTMGSTMVSTPVSTPVTTQDTESMTDLEVQLTNSMNAHVDKYLKSIEAKCSDIATEVKNFKLSVASLINTELTDVKTELTNLNFKLINVKRALTEINTEVTATKKELIETKTELSTLSKLACKIPGLTIRSVNLTKELHDDKTVIESIPKDTELTIFLPVKKTSNGAFVYAMTDQFNFGYVPLWFEEAEGTRVLCVATIASNNLV